MYTHAHTASWSSAPGRAQEAAHAFSRSDDNMRTALDALAAEHGVGVRLPRAASRSGLSMWLVSRRVDTLTHSFKLANMHNNMHLFLHTLISNLAAT